MSHKYDVVVAGAGPAGSTTAALLSQAGYRVALLDRAHFPRSKPCAEYMSPGVIDALWSLGLEQKIAAAHPHPVAGMDIISPGSTHARIEYASHGQARMACTLPRHKFDWLLLEHAAACGADLLEGVVVRDPIVDSGIVRGVIGTHSGKVDTIRATLTVIADGSRSILVRRLGLVRAPCWPVRLGLVAHYEGRTSLPERYGEMHVGNGGYCGVAPLPDGKVNVAMVLPLDTVTRSRITATTVFEQWIQSHPRLGDTLNGCKRCTGVRGVGPVGSRSIRSWAPGALIVGDAATFFDPFTGEGIFRALTGARIAADVAANALSVGNISASGLSMHDSLRRRAFRKKEAVTALVQLFVQYPALMEYALPRLAARPGPREILGNVLGDITDAGSFLRPDVLWGALKP